jgi:2-iminobutanoate/2-iminopropanoate deaminase
MEQQSRRRLLKNAAVTAVAAGSIMIAGKASAQSEGKLEKRDAKAKPGEPKPAKPKLYTDVTACGNMLFVAYKTVPDSGPSVEEQTKAVLDLLEKNLVESGSSLQKVVQAHVYLSDMKDYAKMNAVYMQRNWGDVPPARTCVAVAANVGSPAALVGIDMVALL